MMKLKSFHSESFITTIPILTPRVAGTAMMVSPKTVVAAILAKITGEPEHQSDCKCDLCHYRELKKQNQCEVAGQRAKLFGVVENAFPFKKQDNDELSEDEVIYYYQWFSESFPEIVGRYEDREGSFYVMNKISDSYRSKLDMMFLNLVLQNKRLTYLTDNEIEEIISRHEIYNSGLLDSWPILFEIAEQRKEREELGFESALALDIP